MKVIGQGYMKLLKQILLMMIVLVVVAACSGSADPATPTSAPATETPAVVEEATQEAEPTEESTETTPTEAVEATETDAAATEEASTGSDASLTGATVQVSFPSSVARSGPATSFEAVRQITVNQVFSVVASAGEGSGIWYLVDLGDGTLAWVWARVVTLTPADASVEPAATVPAP